MNFAGISPEITALVTAWNIFSRSLSILVGVRLFLNEAFIAGVLSVLHRHLVASTKKTFGVYNSGDGSGAWDYRFFAV